MATSALVVQEPWVDSHADGVLIRTTFADTPVSWDLPTNTAVVPRGEALVLTALMPAMRLGIPLVLPAGWPIDALFQTHIEELQGIWQLWFPGLRRIAIEAEIAEQTNLPVGRAAGFSGGVDSSYTVATRRSALDALVFVAGIDTKRRNDLLMARIIERNRDTAGMLGLQLLVIRTDVKEYSNQQRLSWTVYHGAALAAVAHLLGLSDYSIAGSNSWENLRPMGSHPLTDPLFGSAGTRILHHGADMHRLDKLRALASLPILLERLRVCLRGEAYNCGCCSKCLQTAAALRVSGLHSDSLARLSDPRALRQIRITSDGDLVDWLEMLEPDLAGSDPDLAGELARLVRRYRTRRLFRELEALAFGGRLKPMLRRFGLATETHRVTG